MDNLFPIGVTTTCNYSYIYMTSQQIGEITITWLRVDVSIQCTYAYSKYVYASILKSEVHVPHQFKLNITQYGSTVYIGIAMVYPH